MNSSHLLAANVCVTKGGNTSASLNIDVKLMLDPHKQLLPAFRMGITQFKTVTFTIQQCTPQIKCVQTLVNSDSKKNPAC